MAESGRGQGDWRRGDQAIGRMIYISDAKCYVNDINIG